VIGFITEVDENKGTWVLIEIGGGNEGIEHLISLNNKLIVSLQQLYLYISAIPPPNDRLNHI